MEMWRLPQGRTPGGEVRWNEPVADAAESTLCVDLDGALVATDLLAESMLQLVKQSPLYLIMLPLWLWGFCPLLLYWISRIRLAAHRGDMHEDPIMYAVRHVPSYLLLAGPGRLPVSGDMNPESARRLRAIAEGSGNIESAKSIPPGPE
jgi:hypothetical protein